MGRSFTDRWFSWPWRPWVKTWMYTPQIPDPSVYKIKDPMFGKPLLVMHPLTLEAYVSIVGKDKICQI